MTDSAGGEERTAPRWPEPVEAETRIEGTNEATAGDTGEIAVESSRPGRGIRRGVLAAALLLYIAGTLGSNLAPALIDDHPLIILALSSRNRNLLGSVPFIDPVPYSVVGFLRILAAGLVLFLVGRWYGSTALGWVEAQVGQLPGTIRWSQRAVGRAGWALVVLMPGSNIVCVLAGQQRQRPRSFVVLLCVGIALKLAVLWAGGKLFEDQIRDVLEVIDRYQWWIVGGLFALTMLQGLGRARRALPEVVEEIERR